MTQAGTVYAQAFYELARDKGLDEAIHSEMEVLDRSFSENPDYIRLLSSANLPKEERCRILDEGFRGKIQPYLLNFLKILVERDHIRLFPDCCRVYTRMYQQDHNILSVTASTAVPLTPAQEAALTEKLSGITGKTILLRNQVDPGVLGGVKLSYDGKCLEDTVSHRLGQIRDLLKNTVL